MIRYFTRRLTRLALTLGCALWLPCACSLALADSYAQPFQPQTGGQQLLAPQQLESLVAPIALYPDALLGEILAASTYPLELVELQQWLQQYRSLQGQALLQAAREQNWDPSVQMLAAFPQAVDLLTREVRWTTDLGNAFLAQQADVLSAIQALRQQAQSNGRLGTTPQQIVTTESQNGQYAIQIQPTNPQVIYPPVYNPAAVWGQQASGSYADTAGYPYAENGARNYDGNYGGNYADNYGGYGFGDGVNIAGLFSGLLNWNGWGWVIGWFTHSLSLASLFFNILGHGSGGYGGAYGGGYGYAGGGALALWAHNPSHRLGVPYPASVRGFNRNFNTNNFNTNNNNYAARAAAPQNWQRFGSGTAVMRPNTIDRRTGAPGFAPPNRTPAQFANQRAPQQVQPASQPAFQPSRNFAPQNFARPQKFSGQQKFPAPKYSEPKYSAQKYSAPKYSAPKYSAPKFSAPKFSAPKTSGKVSAPKSSGGGHSSRKHG